MIYLCFHLTFNFLKIVWNRDYQGAFELGEQVKYKYGKRIKKGFQEGIIALLENKENRFMTDHLKVICIKVLAGLKSN